MIRVIHFSGGKSSGYMTIRLKPTENDIVLFTDTGWEHPATYKFLDDFEANEGINIHRASFINNKNPGGGKFGFDALFEKKAYGYFPNRVKRICTEELKVLTAKRYLRQILKLQHYTSYIGFRSDELDRFYKAKSMAKKIDIQYPMVAWGIIKSDINQFWASKNYTLEIPPILGNCDLCFLKGKAAIIKIMQYFPELADKWIEAEKRGSVARPQNPGTFFKDTTYSELLKIAETLPKAKDKDLKNLADLKPAFSCACNAI